MKRSSLRLKPFPGYDDVDVNNIFRKSASLMNNDIKFQAPTLLM